MKIKILHIIKSLGRGGAEMLLPETLALHDQEKFEFHFIYFLPWKDQMVSEIKSNNGKVTCLEAKNNFQLLGKYPEIVNYCESHKIDLIHCHLPWAGFVGRLVHKKTNIPVIYTEHNMQERYHIATKIINKFSFNSQSLAVGVSDDVVSSIQKNINPKIPVKTILNGVNTQKFDTSKVNSTVRNDFNIPENAFVIGIVSVFRFQKRLKEWIQIIAQFRKQNKNVYGIIVGDGPLKQEVLEEISKHNLQNFIKMPGLQENTRPFFKAMDVFMMSSSFEGLPIALLEAMSMECAIVTTNAGGIKEVVRNEIDGLVVDVDDWEKLTECLQIVYNSEKIKKDLQKAARIRAIEGFSLKAMVEKLENEYLKLTDVN